MHGEDDVSSSRYDVAPSGWFLVRFRWLATFESSSNSLWAKAEVYSPGLRRPNSAGNEEMKTHFPLLRNFCQEVRQEQISDAGIPCELSPHIISTSTEKKLRLSESRPMNSPQRVFAGFKRKYHPFFIQSVQNLSSDQFHSRRSRLHAESMSRLGQRAELM